MKILILFLCVAYFMSCAREPESPYGFSLPEGTQARGEQLFLSYNCLACHSLKGYENEVIKKELSQSVVLGGEYTQVKTYAELVTAVINPSHKLAKGYSPDQISDEDGKSKMWNYNDIMSVSELIDLVAFLQPHYTVKAYELTNYPTYYP